MWCRCLLLVVVVVWCVVCGIGCWLLLRGVGGVVCRWVVLFVVCGLWSLFVVMWCSLLCVV